MFYSYKIDHSYIITPGCVASIGLKRLNSTLIVVSLPMTHDSVSTCLFFTETREREHGDLGTRQKT